MVHHPRLLCLHGGGASSQIMRIQFSKLESALRKTFQLVFLEGPLDSAPGPGVLPFFEDFGPYSCWVSDDKSLLPEEKRKEETNATAYIKTFMLQYGPFAGILGFSQGARATASILLEQQREAFTHDALFGVFFCGTFPPFIPDAPDISLPTVHILGLTDPYLREGEVLLEHCTQQSVRRVIKFNGGHHMPTNPDVTQQIADVISMTYRTSQRKKVSNIWRKKVPDCRSLALES
ncbi:fusarin C cluster-oxidoreductase [Fusarium proliferatum ET1]|uniref:Fusarin C cluster-oxidoreductase n=1 Tax=Fusarium proliferatum (strain ET1) TaxID=1227346 RepID=A0A1L7W6B8_FUSPR|nr:fusarin C cluster-oxidoreductase [Fusarium proliferatum ET1]CZR48165.1 fusarin C cluster-oxidoreductase [Fusarium proliferatum ET1]